MVGIDEISIICFEVFNLHIYHYSLYLHQGTLDLVYALLLDKVMLSLTSKPEHGVSQAPGNSPSRPLLSVIKVLTPGSM